MIEKIEENKKQYAFTYLDLDRTLWTCYNEDWVEIEARDLDKSSLSLKSYDEIEDDLGNTCHLIHYYSALISILKNNSITLNVLSLGLENNLENYKDSASYAILKLLDIANQFNTIIIDKYKIGYAKANIIKKHIEDINKNAGSTYTLRDCLLVDDNPYQLWMAERNGIDYVNSRSESFKNSFA